ncbi:MAG: ribosome-associated heat shock protein Hsp15 [Arenicella sp.]
MLAIIIDLNCVSFVANLGRNDKFNVSNRLFRAPFAMNSSLERVRIDKWLWAARFYKTRQLAIKALKNSQVSLLKQSLKPATNVKVGDLLNIKRGLHRLEIEILALSEKRGSATIAQTLYRETAESIASNTQLKEQLAGQPKVDIDRRKPDKRGVRSHRAVKRGD